MKCPNCGERKTQVVDSRVTAWGWRWRKRRCPQCGGQFETRESYLGEKGKGWSE